MKVSITIVSSVSSWILMGYYSVAVMASSFVERYGELPDGGWGTSYEIVGGILMTLLGPFTFLVVAISYPSNLTDPLWSWPWF